MQELRGHTARRQVTLDEASHAHVLGEDQRARPLGDDRVEQLVQQFQLPRTSGDPRPLLLEELRRVVADLLQARQELHDQSASRHAVGAGDLRERLADHGLVQTGLFRGQ